MAYIKTLKDNELIGGQDNTDVYPISTTQALYSHDDLGNVRMSKTNPNKPETLEERLTNHEENIEKLHHNFERVPNIVNEILADTKIVNIEGDVTNAADEEDLTSVNVGGTDVLKFNDKAYNPLTYSGLGRKYLRKNMVNGINTLTQSMINQANTIYVIQYDFDLNGQTITIPKGCVLKFDGGSLRNGEIICQNTILEGNVSVDVISGSIVGEFKSSFSTRSCDYDKLSILLSLNVDNLVLDEDYSLDSYDGVIQSSLKKVVGNNITISVGCDIVNSNVLGLLLSFNNYPTEISGIKFDFNGHAVRHAIVVQNTAETFYLGDISILNIDNRLENVLTNDHYYCNCINIAPSNNSVVNIANVVVDNMKIWGVGDVGDANGSQYGIFCNCGTNVVEVNVKSCSFENIEDYTYDDNNRTIHDSAGLYVSKNIGVFETSYNIEGIEGTAFGKRLIKTDGGNVKISNVTGYQGNVNVLPLSLISLNSGDSINSNNKAVYVNNITYIGDSNYVVALLGSGDLNNICVFSKSSNHAIIAAGDKGITVNNVYVNGFRPLIYSTNSNLSCTFSNVTFEYNKDDVPETETIRNFYIAVGYGLQIVINNLNLFGSGYGYINFIPGNFYVGQRGIQINGLYYEAYLNGEGVNLASLIEVGSEDYGLDLEINNAIIKIIGNNYRRVFNCPKNSSLTIKNTEINIDAVEIASGSLPYGTFSLGDSNKLHLNNTKVSYRTDWNIGSYSMYISDERTDTSVFNGNSIFICNCNVNEVKKKSGCKTGISFSKNATKVAWSGGDVISVDRLPAGLGINNQGFKTKLSSWDGYGSDKTITWDGFKYVYNIDKVGSTRPSVTNVYVGFQFFDTSINKPIYVSAIDKDTVTWIDATGTIV